VDPDKRITAIQELGQDLAGRYKSTSGTNASAVDPAVVEADLVRLREDGFIVLERLFSEEQMAQVRHALTALFGPRGRNSFEGLATQRAYNVLEKTRAVDALIEHPRILALLDALLMPNYLLSQVQGIHILPGEEAQLLHHDDAFYPLPRPRPALSAASIWALDEFTSSNGATVVVPGSHTWGQDRVPEPAEAKPVVMPAGSVVFFLGTLWHGGGPNRSSAPRMGLAVQYCEPWLRQQENFSLSISRETARTVSEPLRRMIGYSIHNPFMGMVDGMHPKRLLFDTP
jgi:ectoine hydroxylase-related dioxygenase (phytanoyl-CoA dioxygenase family)